MIDFETWWNSSSADEFRRLNDDMDGRVVRPVWDAAIRATLSSQKATSAAPSPEATQPTHSEKHCMNCAAFGECHPNNDAGRCGYEPDQPTQAEAPSEQADAIMAQAQVFASAWSMIGGPCDSMSCLEDAKKEKADLDRMVRAALATQQAVPPANVLMKRGEWDALSPAAKDLFADLERRAAMNQPARIDPLSLRMPHAPEQQAVQGEPAFLTDTDVARIYRSVYGGTRWGATEREFAKEIELAVRSLYTTPPAPGQAARHDKTCASLLDGGAAGPCDCSAPGQVERDREDAELFRWIEKHYRIGSLHIDGQHAWMPVGMAIQRPIGRTFREAIRAARSSEGGDHAKR